MRTNLLFIFLISAFSCSAQIDTIVIKNTQLKIYHGLDEQVVSWFMFTEDEQLYTLCQLDIPESELEEWYYRFSDSQNLYRAEKLVIGEREVLKFRRANNRDQEISFEIIERRIDGLKLFVREFGDTYNFELLN